MLFVHKNQEKSVIVLFRLLYIDALAVIWAGNDMQSFIPENTGYAYPFSYLSSCYLAKFEIIYNRKKVRVICIKVQLSLKQYYILHFVE